MLYIVATPIGNLDDLSFRAAKILLSSDIILAEDTRSAKILLERCQSSIFNLPSSDSHPQIISYYKEKEFEKLPFIISELKIGKNISLISESGMPLISDPGYLLVKTCIKENIPYTVIPGPNAIITALAHSGFNPEYFMFLGFLPKKITAIEQLINRAKKIKEIFPDMIFVFYESPQRINNTLSLMSRISPHLNIVICRELTKKFEEIIRGKAADLLKREYKGEIVLLLF